MDLKTMTFIVVGIAGVFGIVFGTLWVTGNFSPEMIANPPVNVAVALAVLTYLLLMLMVPIVNVASQVIWQTKVDEGVQGRVFSLRRMIAQAVSPVAILLAGPLADGVFEPLLAPGGGLSSSVGSLIGTGPGRGVGFLYVVAGLATMRRAAVGWLMPRVRLLEQELPDVAGHE